MSYTHFMDNLVRDFLLWRGFTSALRTFDAEIKVDKDKGFKVDKIVEQFGLYISNYELSNLLDAWEHWHHKVFCRLEQHFVPVVHKLEVSLLKLYVINCIQTNRHDRVVEFFDRLTPTLHNQSEWKEWFALPFLKNADENPSFAVYFTRQWQESLMLSLHNFLSVIFQHMPVPTLMAYEEELHKHQQLQDENEMLKQQTAALQAREIHNSVRVGLKPTLETKPICGAMELADDFYCIAQASSSGMADQDSQLKSLKNLIRNFRTNGSQGLLPTSPVASAKTIATEQHCSNTQRSALNEKPATSSPRPESQTTSPGSRSLRSRLSNQGDADSAGDANSLQGLRRSSSKDSKMGSDTSQKDPLRHPSAKSSKGVPANNIECNSYSQADLDRPFILLCQEEYCEHQSTVTNCKFNASGTLVASCDLDGIIKIWSPSPTPRTVTTVISKTAITALEWANKRERLLLHGNRLGGIRLYDTKEKRTLCEIGNETKDQTIVCLTCSPSETSFVCCTAGVSRANLTNNLRIGLPHGLLLLWDMKTMKMIKQLPVEQNSVSVNYCCYNQTGQLLLTSTSDGRVQLYDMKQRSCVANWVAHQGEAHTVLFSNDEASCYSIGSDCKLVQWSISQTGRKISECALHDSAVGPFVLPSSATKYKPTGKLFTTDATGNYALTCSQNGGVVYQVGAGSSSECVTQLRGHGTQVSTVDWTAAMDCNICATASMDGRVRISTLLAAH